jgi:hypothetical protein
MKNIRRKTYHNFLIVRNKLMREKGYDPTEASELTHLIFENAENDGAGRSVEHFYDMVLSKTDYEAQYAPTLGDFTSPEAAWELD